MVMGGEKEPPAGAGGTKKVSKQIKDLFSEMLKNKKTFKPLVQRHIEKNKNETPLPSVSGKKADNSIEVSPEGYYSQSRTDIEQLIPQNAKRILDIGCGEGILGKRLLSKGAEEVVGIEIVPEVSKKAQKNLTRVICGDIEKIELPFDKGYFDCIILADILEHLKDPLSTLKKLRPYLCSDGIVVASIPNVRFFLVINMLVEGRWQYSDSGVLDRTHLRFFTKKEMEDLFAQADFDITGITYNLHPEYHNINPQAEEITIGRTTIRNLNPEELKDLFVFQYLIRAERKKIINISQDEDLNEAFLKLKEHLLAHPADTKALLQFADICIRLRKYNEANDSIDTVLMFEPDNKQANQLRKRILELSHAS